MAYTADLTKGNITRHFIHLATPLIIGNILQQLYNTVDAFILGHLSGSLEFAAVGIAGSVMNLFLFMITGACTGISVIFAQLYGAGDESSFRCEHWLSLVLGMGVTCICSSLGFLLLPALLRMIKTPDSLLPLVTDYLHIILAGLLAAFLYNLYNALLRAIGYAKVALYALSVAVVINMVLDYIFIAWFQLGIKGAAWATICSQMLAAVLCISYLYLKTPNFIFTRKECYINHSLLQKTAYFSFVTGLHQTSLYIGKLLVQGAVNTGGTDMISAYTTTTRIEGFANSFGDSGCSATSVLVAQNLGAGKKERIQKIFQCSMILMFLLGLLMSVLMFFSADASVGFLLGEHSGTAFENAGLYMKTIAVFYTLCFLGNAFAGYFDGMGNVSIPFIGSTCHIALRVILSWLLVEKMGLPAVAIATGLGWLLVNVMWAAIKRKKY